MDPEIVTWPTVGPTPLSVFRVTGPDRQTVLNDILTNDIKSLTAGQGVHACLLTPQGKLVSHCFLHHRGDDLLGLAPPDALAPLLAGLEKYLALTETRIDALLSWMCLAMIGDPPDPSLWSDSASSFPAGDRLLGRPFHRHPHPSQ